MCLFLYFYFERLVQIAYMFFFLIFILLFTLQIIGYTKTMKKLPPKFL